MRTLLAVLLALGAVALGPAGCVADEKYSQTELNALQTREYDYPYDAVFDSTVGALFDLGYTITTSDKRGGLLAAQGRDGGVQVKLDQAGPRRTAVRVSTSSYGQSRMDKPRIDAVHAAIDRRLAMGAPGAPPAPAKGSR